MLKKEKPIEQLFNELLQSLRDWGMTDYSVRNYYYEGICPIRAYYDGAGKTLYDEAFTETIIADIKRKCIDGIVSECIRKSVCKIAGLLKNYDNGFHWCHIETGTKEVPESNYYSDLANQYHSYECKLGLRTKVTIKGDVRRIRQFFRWLEESVIETLEQLSLMDVSNFLTYYGERRPLSIREMLCSLRKLCAFIKQCDIESLNFSAALIARPAKRSKLRPTFSSLDAEEILAMVDTSTSIGKRDYAILHIAKELGVRAGDIMSLKLSDMSWEGYTIRFRQNKTQAELELPLEPIVGNAIADYILNGRPQTDSNHIFVRTRAPYTKLSSLNNIIRKYAPHGKHEKFSGIHSFRRGIASQLLNAGIDADTTKGILGHVKINSLKPYARISTVRLESCAMNLSGIETTREGLQ